MLEHSTSRALLPQSPYKKFSLKPYHIKYYGLIAVFLMMIAAIKVFINYATIQTSILQVIKETQMIDRHKQYLSLQAYTYGLPEAQQFISHDNGVLLKGERVFVKVQGTGAVLSGNTNSNKELQEDIAEKKLSPLSSWIQYFAKKMAK